MVVRKARLRPWQLELHNEIEGQGVGERGPNPSQSCVSMFAMEGQPDPLYGSAQHRELLPRARPGESDSTKRGQIGEEGISDKKDDHRTENVGLMRQTQSNA